MKNVILSGGIFHPFEETSAHLAKHLESIGIQSEIFTDVEAGLAHADDTRADLLTFNLLRWRMQGEKYDEYRDEWAFELSTYGRETIRNHVDRGGALFGLHTASICFDTWPQWPALLGAGWVWGESYHPAMGPVTAKLTGTAHPITRGIGGFDVEDEVYTALELEPDVEGLVEALPGDGAPAQPLFWARTCGESRVVYDALGHDVASLAEPTHARLWTRGVLWSLGRDDEIGEH